MKIEKFYVVMTPTSISVLEDILCECYLHELENLIVGVRVGNGNPGSHIHAIFTEEQEAHACAVELLKSDVLKEIQKLSVVVGSPRLLHFRLRLQWASWRHRLRRPCLRRRPFSAVRGGSLAWEKFNE